MRNFIDRLESTTTSSFPVLPVPIGKPLRRKKRKTNKKDKDRLRR